jgi:hypothetical protein
MFNPHRRIFFRRGISALVGTSIAGPALAQDMGQNGVAIPSFFFSGYERRQREACENKLPECRPAVRAQINFEKDISLFIPWVGLGLGVIALLAYMRKKEQQKEAKRKLAQAHHVPGSFKKMGEHVGQERGPAPEVDDRF